MKMLIRSGLTIVTACVLISCASTQDSKLNFKSDVAANVVRCSFENLTWQDTGEFAERWVIFGRDFMYNWHITQCAGRDPQPLKCHFTVIYDYGENAGGRVRLFCENKNGEMEDYRYLSGLIEND